MDEKGARLRWGLERRMEFIDFRLFWDGRLNRSDLVETFGISAAQASADLAAYERIAPSNLGYDRALKRYERGAVFRPVFIGKTVERYLLQIVAVENGWMDRGDTWFEEMPPVEVVTLGRPRTDPGILLGIIEALRNGLELEVRYGSLTGTTAEARAISPHAMFHSAGRWYVRSWSREHDDFRDYNMHRIREVGTARESAVDVALDFEWAHRIDMAIVPNPELDPDRRAAVAAEHDMTDGRLVLPCRLSLAFYLMSWYNLDVPQGKLDPLKQQLVLENREQVGHARAAARQMSKEALARGRAGGRGSRGS